MNNIFLITANFLGIEIGSWADWVSGLISAISVLLVIITSIFPKKPRLRFELIREVYPTSVNSTDPYYYSLLVQNEEQYSLNLKIRAKEEMYDNRVIHLPSINYNNEKPVFFKLPLNLAVKEKIIFRNMTNRRKIKVKVKRKGNIVLFWGDSIFSIAQGVNDSIKEKDFIKLT